MVGTVAKFLSGVALATTAGTRVYAFSPELNVQFNHNAAQSYNEPYRKISRPGDDLEKTLIAHVESATSTLWIAVQEIRLPELAKAIARRQRAGVQVRMILENSYHYDLMQIQEDAFDKKTGYHGERNLEYFKFADANHDGKVSHEEALDRDAVYILRQAGVAMIDDTADGSAGSGLMHHKFIIVDGKSVVVTSANFTMSDIHGDYFKPGTRGNANSLMSFENAKLASVFAEEFMIMWGSEHARPRFGVQKPYRGPTTVRLNSGEDVTVQFAGTSRKLSSEQSTLGLILRSLRQAKRSVNLALFVFSESEFSEALRKRKDSQALEIKALIEPTFAYRYYSKALDMWGLQLLPENCRPAPGSNPWSSPITTVGVPAVEDGDFLHHKFAVVDSDTTIFGSHNWSRAASDLNDETLMVIKSADVAVAFEQEFRGWYRGAQLGAPAWLVKRVRESQLRCH